MKSFLVILVSAIAIYLLFFKNTRTKSLQEIKEDNQKRRVKDNFEFKDPEHSLLYTLNNIDLSEKVTLGDIKDQWSVTKDTIDANLNQKIVRFIMDTIDTLGLFMKKDYYLHTIENIYVMKDTADNFRLVGDAFLQDIKSFYSVRITFDFLKFDDIVYINYVDVDESSVNNIMDRYNVKWNSQGILSGYNAFNKDIVQLLDNHYKSNSNVISLNKDTRDSALEKTLRIVQVPSQPNKPSIEFPMFCKKNTNRWGYEGSSLPTIQKCMFHNPYYAIYPNQPYFAPGITTQRSHTERYKTLYE
jgi:hypothetical protein